MTEGEYRVRAAFNPSASEAVGQIKNQTGQLIDLCNAVLQACPDDRSSEVYRLTNLAKNSYEEAAMWAVKAATTPAKE